MTNVLEVVRGDSGFGEGYKLSAPAENRSMVRGLSDETWEEQMLGENFRHAISCGRVINHGPLQEGEERVLYKPTEEKVGIVIFRRIGARDPELRATEPYIDENGQKSLRETCLPIPFLTSDSYIAIGSYREKTFKHEVSGQAVNLPSGGLIFEPEEVFVASRGDFRQEALAPKSVAPVPV